MTKKLILVTGGARSGKSSWAEHLVCEAGLKRFYIATAPVCDAEMQSRVALHQAGRTGKNWVTIEEELDLKAALEQVNEAGGEAVLVDCLTLWINNLLYHAELNHTVFDERVFSGIMTELLQKISELPFTSVLVINEVGMGIVPDNSNSRIFRDCSGRAAQLAAAQADEVYWCVAGIPQKIKG